jgi:uncharacterized protein (TIGR03546 family)
MLFLNTAKSLLSILQADDSPWQVAVAAALGMVAGFSPFSGPQNYVIFILLMFLNVNLGAAAVSTALFAAIAVFLDPLANAIGYFLLVKSSALTPLWTRLYNLPIVPYTHFYNTVALGGFVIAVAAFIPVMLLTRWGLLAYRARWQAKVNQWGIMKWFKLTAVVNLAEKHK